MGVSAAMQRVGVFGGAFDPPHRAHRALAEAALSVLRLDRLHLLPTGQAWHKSRNLTAAEHRVEMCDRAFGDLPGAFVDRREIQRNGATYTVDTLDELGREYPGARLFLLIGADQRAAFKTWKRWTDILAKATLVVADRQLPGDRHTAAAETPGHADPPFVSLNSPLMPISATAIRDACAAGALSPAELAQLVPEAVASYISQHSLYQKPS